MKYLVTVTAIFGLLALCPAQAAAPAVDSHTQAATELLSTMNVEKQVAGGVEVMAEQMIRTNPMLGPYREVILKWAASYMTWDAIGPGLVSFYQQAFSEEELRKLTAFYKTPLGQKTLTVMPDLFRRSAELGSTLARDHLPELEAAIRARAADLEKTTAKP